MSDLAKKRVRALYRAYDEMRTGGCLCTPSGHSDSCPLHNDGWEERKRKRREEIRMQFVHEYQVGAHNIVGVETGRINQIGPWYIVITARDPSRVSWPWEYEGMPTLVRQGEPGILAYSIPGDER